METKGFWGVKGARETKEVLEAKRKGRVCMMDSGNTWGGAATGGPASLPVSLVDWITHAIT